MKKIILFLVAVFVLSGCAKSKPVNLEVSSDGAEVWSDAITESSSGDFPSDGTGVPYSEIIAEYFIKEFDLKTKKINENSEIKIEHECDYIENKEKVQIEFVKDGEIAWDYRTKAYDTAQAWAISNFRTDDNKLFFKEGTSLVCMDMKTGKRLWNHWGVGYGGELIFYEDKIYTWSFDGPRLVVLNKNGKELHRIESTNDFFDVDVMRPFGDKLYITHYGPSYCITELDMQTAKPTGKVVTAQSTDSSDNFRSYTVQYTNNGEIIWEFKTTPVNMDVYHLNYNMMADESTVYILTNNVINALDKETGKKLWSAGDLDYEGAHGCCMDEDKLYYNDGLSVAAVDKKSGERLWTVKDVGRAKIVVSDGYVCASEAESGNYVIISADGDEVARGKLPGIEVYGISVCDGKLMMECWRLPQ